MTKQEFKTMCHSEFVKRGFIKKKSSYYKEGSDGLQCRLSYQSSYGSGYYINCDFYLINPLNATTSFERPDIMGRAFRVLSKDTIKGKPFMTSAIYYSDYELDEVVPFISLALDEYILPALEKGRTELLRGIKEGIWHFNPFLDKSTIGLDV